MKEKRKIILWGIFTVAVVVAIIVSVYFLKNNNKIDKEEFVGRRDVEYTGEVLQTLEMTWDVFFNSVVGVTERSGRVTEENNHIVKYDTVIYYNGRLLQGIVEETVAINGEKVGATDDIKFKVYSEYKKIPDLYKFGMCMYYSFQTGELDEDVKVLFAVDEENKVSVYRYKDVFYFVVLDEYEYEGKKFDTFLYTNDIPEGYEEQINEKLNQILGDSE